MLVSGVYLVVGTKFITSRKRPGKIECFRLHGLYYLLFLFYLFILRRMGKKEAYQISFHTSTYKIHVVCHFNPKLSLRQQLTLLLPGA